MITINKIITNIAPEFFSRSVTIDKYSEKSTIQNVSKFIHNEIID